MQQATVNLLADMGAQPATRMSGLSLATKSSDTAAPTATITSPANGGTVAPSTTVTISGTATDAGGGQVGAVEVSTDGGTTWRTATGRGTWTYSWTTPSTPGSVNLKARAVDDSANLQATSASATVNVGTTSTPAAPSGLTATQAAGPQVSLTWTDNATTETGFVVERSTNGGAFTQIATPGPLAGTGSVTYVDTNVAAGTAYAYRVAAVNASGPSGFSGAANVTLPSAPPTAPTGLSTTLLAGPQVRLTWTDNATTETGFVVQRSTAGGGFAEIATPGPLAGTGSVTYVDTTVASGTVYTYRVAAVSAAGTSAFSNTADATVPVAVPATPTSLTRTLQAGPAGPQVSLTWTDNATTETSFVVQRSTAGGAFTQIATPGPRADTGSVTYVDTTVVPGTAYRYRVAAANAGGTSPFTAASTSLTVPAVPAAPSSLAAPLQAGQAGPQVSLTWTDNATTETAFVVQRSTNAGGFVQIAAPGARSSTGSVTYVDTTVVAGNAYSYRVAAANASGTSAFSNTVSVTLPAQPDAPSPLTATNGANSGTSRSVGLTWTDASSNETGFTVQRATNATFTSGLNTASVAAGVTTLTQTGLTRNRQYWYRIRAINGPVISSVWVNATPFPILTNP